MRPDQKRKIDNILIRLKSLDPYFSRFTSDSFIYNIVKLTNSIGSLSKDQSYFMCNPSLPMDVCDAVVEKGWDPFEFLGTVLFLLSEAEQKAPRFADFFREQISLVETAIKLQRQTEQVVDKVINEKTGIVASFEKFKSDLRSKILTAEHFFFNIGTRDHCIYVEFFTDSTATKWAILYDSSGRFNHHTKDLLAYPLCINISIDSNIEKIMQAIKEIIEMRRTDRGIDSNLQTFVTLKYLGQLNRQTSEPCQVTKNCAWKAYALLLKENCRLKSLDTKQIFDVIRGICGEWMFNIDQDFSRAAYNITQVAAGAAISSLISRPPDVCGTISSAAEAIGVNNVHTLLPTGCDDMQKPVKITKKRQPGTGYYKIDADDKSSSTKNDSCLIS